VIFGLLIDYLAFLTDALAAAGYAPPERSVVVDGEPADDLGAAADGGCEALYVWAGRVAPASQGTSPLSSVEQPCIVVPVVEVRARYLRCVEVREEPTSVAVLESEAAELDGRAWVLWSATVSALFDGTLIEGCDCRTSTPGVGEWMGRAGGVAAFEWVFTLEVPWLGGS
jgi:hypothetical protein